MKVKKLKINEIILKDKRKKLKQKKKSYTHAIL